MGWAANIVAAIGVWVAHECLPKERENAKTRLPQWKVSFTNDRLYSLEWIWIKYFNISFTNMLSYIK